MFMKSNFKTVRKKVLGRIKPTFAEMKAIEAASKELIGKIAKAGHKAVLAGSAGRGTFVSNDKREKSDLDIFVFYPKDKTKEQLGREILKLGKRLLKTPETHYAEHPYTKGFYKGFLIELVPCYEMKLGSRPISAVDRSPLHHKYIVKNLKENKKEDVILLKQCLAGCEAYGAEHKVKGFSGYLCELLTIKYGSFEKVLKASAKFGHPFIFIDPVDTNRNVAAAVSEEKLEIFRKKAAEYLKRPSENFFFPKEKPVLQGFDAGNTITITMPAPNIIEEILWSQLERLKIALEAQLKIRGFIVTKSKHWADEKKTCLLAFEFTSLKISDDEVHRGPFITDAENAAAFRGKNKNWFVKDGRLYSMRQREFTDAKKCLQHLLKTMDVPSHFKNGAKKAKIGSIKYMRVKANCKADVK